MTMLKQNDSTKESYLRPESEVIIIKLEGFLCGSSGNAQINVISTTIHGFDDGGTSDITVFQEN